MCLWVILAIVLLAAVVAVAFIYLPIWAALLVLVGLLLTLALSFKWMMTKVIERFALGLFDMKSRALRDAEAVVHAVKPAQAPAKEADEDGGDDEQESEKQEKDADDGRAYYTVEATITPKAAGSGGKSFGMWDVDDLQLVPFDMKVTKSADEDTDDDTCDIRRVLVQVDGQYQELEGPKLEGPHRLEFLVGVKPGNKRLKFRYYFEAFGDVRLP